MGKSVRVVLRNVRALYPRLFRAEEFMGKTNYSCGFLLEPDSAEYKAVCDAIQKAVAEEYGAQKAPALLRKFAGSRNTWPLRKQDEEQGGCWIIQPKRAESKGRPKVYDRRKNLTDDESLVYSGCYVTVSLDVYCYTQNGGGVTSYLNGVQFVRKGAPLSGSAASCEQDFDDLGEDPDEAGTADDGDLPF